MITLVCRSCGGALEFTERGWRHRDPSRLCEEIRVAWPPPTEDDLDEAFDPAPVR